MPNMSTALASCFAVVINLAFLSGTAQAANIQLWCRFNSDPGGPVHNGSPVTGAVDSGPNHLTGSAVGTMTYNSNVPPLGKLSLNHTQDFS